MTWLIHSLLFLAFLVCYILVLIKIFQHGQIALGIACILLSLCFGLGALVALIYGWVKAREWAMQNLMITWSVVWVIEIALQGAYPLPWRAFGW